MDWQEKYEAMRLAVLEGEEELCEELAKEHLAAGGNPLEALNQGFLKGIREVGDLYESGEYYLPELVAAAEAMNLAVAVLQDALVASAANSESKGTVVIATVEGDIHDIGKTIVASLFTAYGYRVVDLGVAVADGVIVEAVAREKADVVALSALLTTTMAHQQSVIEALQDKGLREKVKVLVGGAPVSADWASRIGADGYGDNAVEAVKVCDALLA